MKKYLIIIFSLLLVFIIHYNTTAQDIEFDNYKKKLLKVSVENKINCFNNLVNVSKNNLNYIELRNLLLDTLNKWKSMKLKYTNYDNSLFEYIHDVICFNRDFNKAYIFFIKIDTVFSINSCSIKFIYCFKENDIWQFYNKSVASIFIDKEFLKEYLGNVLIFKGVNIGPIEKYFEKMIATNYFLDGECTINYEFLEHEDINELRKKHIEFLNGN